MKGRVGWTKLFFYTIAVAIYLSYYAIRPFENELSLSDIILQISGSRGSIIMGTSMPEIISFAFKLVPDLVLECYLGVSLYQNYCTASVFIFSRIPNRKKWYIKETWLLMLFVFVYETILHILMLVFSVFRFDVRFDLMGLFLFGYNILLRTLWIFLTALLMNICGILFGGSNFGIGVIMVQLIMIALLSLCKTCPATIHFNPITMLVLGWYNNISPIGRSFEETGFNIFLISIAVEFLGLRVVCKKDIIVSDLERD